MRTDVENRPVALSPGRMAYLRCAAHQTRRPLPPLHGPEAAMSSSHRRASVANRNVSMTTLATPAASTASATAWAASADSASGFSRMRCRPARAAARATSAWTAGGHRRLTTSTASRQRADAFEGGRTIGGGELGGHLRAALLHTPASSKSRWSTIAGVCTSCAHEPPPTRPTRSRCDIDPASQPAPVPRPVRVHAPHQGVVRGAASGRRATVSLCAGRRGTVTACDGAPRRLVTTTRVKAPPWR